MRWLRLPNWSNFASRRDILLTEHQKSCSVFSRRFLVFELIVAKVEPFVRNPMLLEIQEAD